jgi:hypothetical protein
MVMFWTYILEVLGLHLSWDISYPEIFHGFPQTLWANSGIVPQIRPRLLDSHLLHFVIYLSFYHLMLCSLATDSIIKY